jgi:hypothetical protein
LGQEHVGGGSHDLFAGNTAVPAKPDACMLPEE